MFIPNSERVRKLSEPFSAQLPPSYYRKDRKKIPGKLKMSFMSEKERGKTDFHLFIFLLSKLCYPNPCCKFSVFLLHPTMLRLLPPPDPMILRLLRSYQKPIFFDFTIWRMHKIRFKSLRGIIRIIDFAPAKRDYRWHLY